MKLLRISALAITMILVCASIMSAEKLAFTAKSFSMDTTAADIVEARAGGETAISIWRREKLEGALYAFNGMYFDPVTMAPSGYLFCFPEEETKCPCRFRRGYLYLDDRGYHISGRVPANAYFVAQCGLILLTEDGTTIPYPPEGGEAYHADDQRPRTVVALVGRTICVYHFAKATLRQVADFLKEEGCSSAVNLDGGSSTPKYAKVANAVVIYQKSVYVQKNRRYRDYLEQQRALRVAESFVRQICHPAKEPWTDFGFGRMKPEPSAYEPWSFNFRQGY